MMDGLSNACPEPCGLAISRIEEARDPLVAFGRINQMRVELGNCGACLHAFDTEIKLKTTLAMSCADAPPPHLATRISAALERVDLSQLDITDF